MKTKRRPAAKSTSMSARQCLDCLEARHSDEVFVPECKNGPTQGSGGHSRLDAWAMRKSWSSPCLTGYEVKVSRADFLKDKKWPSYLPLCNQLYFACPAGLLQPEEMPQDVGLVWCYSAPSRVITKKRATHRLISDPVSLYQYVLMCRTKVTREYWGGETREDRAAFWREWLETKGELSDVGHRASKVLREQFSEKVTRVECNQQRLEKELEKYKDLSAFLEQNGLSVHNYRINDRVAELFAAVPKDFQSAVDRTLSCLESLKASMNAMNE